MPVKDVYEKPSLYIRRYMGGNYYRYWRIRSRVFGAPNGVSYFAFPSSKYAPDDSWPYEVMPIHKGKRIKMKKYNKKINTYRQYCSHWQPCFSNPKTVDIAVKNILEIFEKEPRDPSNKERKRYYVELSCNDNGGHCECAKCLKAVNGKRNALGRLHYSELYWAWINAVTARLVEKYPDLYVVGHAYRENYDAPAFQLHKNVIVCLCKELVSGVINPAEKVRIEEMMKNWNKRCSLFIIWDYLENTPHLRADYGYVLPRVHLNSYAEMIRLAYKYNVRGIYMEGSHQIPITGPTYFIMSRLYWNINTDVDKAVKEWCEVAVGKKAAKDLEAYYRFWESYWLRKEMKETNWGMGAHGTYLPLGESGSYTYLLTKEDMAKTRQLLDNVVSKAETPDQKTRAEFFRRLYGFTVHAVNCMYSVHLQKDGTLKDAAAAEEMLRSIPLALKSLEALKKDPLVPPSFVERSENAIRNLRAVNPYKDHPRVRKVLKELSTRPGLPAALKGQINILLGVKYKNLLENGSFEKPLKKDVILLRKGGKQDQSFASDGKYGFKVVQDGGCHFETKKIIPGKTYIFLVDVYASKVSGEGRFFLLTNPRKGKQNMQYNLIRDIRLNKGWQTLSNTFTATSTRNWVADSIMVRAWALNFEDDEPLWLDNYRLYQLD